MVERNIYIFEELLIFMDKRVVFPSGKQKEFIKLLKDKTYLSWPELSKKLEINVSTLSKAYMFESCSIPYNVFKKIIALLNLPEEETIIKYNLTFENTEKIIGVKCFGKQKKTFSKVKILFKKNSLELDVSKIEFSPIDLIKKIKLPNKITPELAEEVGIHYGDGFLSAKRYNYRLKGNQITEIDYYKNYIAPLFKKLYNFDVNLKDYKTSFGFELCSKGLWEFKTKVLKIAAGPKKDIRFPEPLKVNNLKILCSFIRGLFDTDGCVSFKSKYGYKEYYPSVELSLYSIKLIDDVADILKMLGFNPVVNLARGQSKISLNGVSSLKRYEKMIGWSSPKNLKKVENWKNRYPQLNMVDVAQW